MFRFKSLVSLEGDTMFFSGNSKKTEVVPVLLAASREAGRVVTGSAKKQKSGVISAVRPAVGGNRTGPQQTASGMRAAVSPAVAGASTQIMPAQKLKGAQRDGRSVAIWVLAGLLMVNMFATVLLLANMDHTNPELLDHKVQVNIAQEELAAMKAKFLKLSIDSEMRLSSLQTESDGIRLQLQLLQDQTQSVQRVVRSESPYHSDSSSASDARASEAVK